MLALSGAIKFIGFTEISMQNTEPLIINRLFETEELAPHHLIIRKLVSTIIDFVKQCRWKQK
jgi:hypothetical protein